MFLQPHSLARPANPRFAANPGLCSIPLHLASHRPGALYLVHETPRCPPAAALGKGPALALQADDQAGRGRDHGHRRGVRPGRDAPPAVRPLVVPGLRLRAGLRLAQQRRDHRHLRGAEGGGQDAAATTWASWWPAARAPPAAKRPRRSPHAADRHAISDRRAADLRLADERQGRFGRRAGRIWHLPPQVLLHARGAVVRGPAGHGREKRLGPALSLAGRERRGFRLRAARRRGRPGGAPGRDDRRSRSRRSGNCCS